MTSWLSQLFGGNNRKTMFRKCLLAILCGVSAAAALPPYFMVVLLWPALGAFAWLVCSALTLRRAALFGWCFGLGFFGLGLYWIGEAFLVDAQRYGWMRPFAITGMAAGMAFFTSLLGGVLNWTVRRFAIQKALWPLAFAVSWTVVEWLRGELFSGFPWNPLASIWTGSVEILQASAWFGTLGLGFLSALIFSAPTAVSNWRNPFRDHAGLVVCIASCVLLSALWVGGSVRIAAHNITDHDNVMLRLVQPNIDQALKWKPALRQSHILKQMALSRRNPGPGGTPTHVIWGETNVPVLLTPDTIVPASLAPAVPKGGHLTFGAPRRDALGNVYNSVMTINDDGRVQLTYDKFHLVPFGEYVPLRGWLPIEKLTAGRGDFAPGEGPETFSIPGLPSFGVLICYEIIFSTNVVETNTRPDWLINLTNDAWFGTSSGPYQHLAQAQLRAAEYGLPVVRVANTGISAVIDPLGRIRKQLGLGAQGIVDSGLPKPLSATAFSLAGNAITFLMIALTIGLIAGLRISTRRQTRE